MSGLTKVDHFKQGRMKCQFDVLQLYVSDTYDGNASVIVTLARNKNTMLSADCWFWVGLEITPSNVTFKAGDVLTCDSDGDDDFLFYFQHWSGTTGIGTDSEDTFAYYEDPFNSRYGPNLFILPEGPFDLTCTVVFRYEWSCMETTTIMDTAYSKYHKQHMINYVLSNTVSDQSFCRRPYNNFIV